MEVEALILSHQTCDGSAPRKIANASDKEVWLSLGSKRFHVSPFFFLNQLLSS